MKTIFYLITAVCATVISACGPRAIEYRTYDLDAVTTERDIKMSDLADNLRVVILESDKDFRIPSESQSWVNEKYIIVFGKNAIEQFSSVDGTHVRTLLQKDDDEEGFDLYINPIVDDEKQVLFFTKAHCDITQCIDLNTGSFLSDDEIDYKAGFVPDGQLLLEKTLMDNLGTETNVQNEYVVDLSDSTIIDFDDETKKEITLVSNNGSDFFLQKQEIFLQKYTLYSMNEGIASPYCSFIYKDDIGKDKLGIEGTYLDIEYVDSKSIITSLVETRMKVKQSSFIIKKYEKMSTIIDRESTKIAKLGKFIINPHYFEYEGTFHSPTFFRGKTMIAYSIEALALRDCLEDVLSSESISSSTRSQLESIINRLYEDSNPVFVIGTKK